MFKSMYSADLSPTPVIENKGASITDYDSRQLAKGIRNLSQERLCLLTCLLMGDPGWRAAIEKRSSRRVETTGEINSSAQECLCLLDRRLMGDPNPISVQPQEAPVVSDHNILA